MPSVSTDSAAALLCIALCLARCHFAHAVVCAALPLSFDLWLKTDEAKIEAAFARHVFACIDVVDQLIALFALAHAGHSAHGADGLHRAFLQVSSPRVLTCASGIATGERLRLLPWFQTRPAEDELFFAFHRTETAADPVFSSIRVFAEVVARRTLLDNG